MRRLSVLLALALVPAASAHASFPGPDGGIVFESGGGLATFLPGTTAATPLETGSSTALTDPAYSPDGRWVAYKQGLDIWIARSDGRGARPVTRQGKTDSGPAFSPDGKRIALVSNVGSSSYRLWLAENTGKADDFLLTTAKATPTRACKVSWRSDSQVVIIVQGDALCGEDVSTLARVGVGSVRDERGLSATGDDPAFRPPVSGG